MKQGEKRELRKWIQSIVFICVAIILAVCGVKMVYQNAEAKAQIKRCEKQVVKRLSLPSDVAARLCN